MVMAPLGGPCVYFRRQSSALRSEICFAINMRDHLASTCMSMNMREAVACKDSVKVLRVVMVMI